MRVLGIDLETTGIDPDKGEITEIAVVLQDTPLLNSKPLLQQSALCQIQGEIPEEVVKITKITKEMLNDFGFPLANILENIEAMVKRNKPDFIVAHNGEIFDKPWLTYHAKSCKVSIDTLQKTPWIDTAADIPEDCFGTRKLSYMAAECGFLNPFPHSALQDVLTMLKVLGHVDIDLIVKRSQEPWVVVRAMTNYDQRELAKKAKFRWQDCGDGKVYDKCWVKRVKKSDADPFIKSLPFKAVIIG